MKRNIVLGAGVSGLAANHRLKQLGFSSVCYEKSNKVGGLCSNFEIDGFTFDQFVHLSFTEDEDVKRVFAESTNFYTHNPEAMNYADGVWIRHPVQNNLYILPTEEKVKIIKGFTERKRACEINNYEDWLKAQYGDYFSEKYPMRYTRKYWGVDSFFLGTEWTNGRIYIPTIEEILYSAFEKDTKNVFYAKEMRYPQKGGFEAFLKSFVDMERIECNMKVERINTKERKIYFSNSKEEEYDNLISTIPIPELIDCLSDVDNNVKEAANRLKYTSGYVVSVGLKKVVNFPSLWFYIYDEDIPPARIYSPSMKSKYNAPIGKSSLQAEIYFSNNRNADVNSKLLLDKTINRLVEMGLFEKEDIEVVEIRYIEYANVVCDSEIERNRKIVLDYLNDMDIITAGRFGEWKYFWSDQSYQSGRIAVEKNIRRFSE